MSTQTKASGKKLAQESPVNADMVIGVPNLSLSAASGYAANKYNCEYQGGT